MSFLYLEQLGDLQQKILKHLLECNNEGVESVNHIARALHAHQPAVHRSVKALEKDGYLLKEKEYVGRVKAVTLTSKGIAAALVLGGRRAYTTAARLTIKKFQEDNPDFMQDYVRLFSKLQSNDPVRMEATRSLLEGKSAKEWKKGMIDVVATMLEAAFYQGEVHDSSRKITQLVEKYDVDKNEVRNVLEERRQQLDSIIGQLK